MRSSISRQGGWSVDLELPRSTYHPEEELAVEIRLPADKSGFLYVFNVDEKGQQVNLWYPNTVQPSSQVTANQGEHPASRWRLRPADCVEIYLPAELPEGVDRERNLFVAIVSPTRIQSLEAAVQAAAVDESVMAEVRAELERLRAGSAELPSREDGDGYGSGRIPFEIVR